MIDATCNVISGFNDYKFETNEEFTRIYHNRLDQGEKMKSENIAYGGK